MKMMPIVLSVAFLAGCASPGTDTWYGKKLADQDRPGSTLNAPTPDKADADKAQAMRIR